MNVIDLNPSVEKQVLFNRDGRLLVPEKAGCYVLTNHSGEIIYIGRAKNLRARMNTHLNDPEKEHNTKYGVVRKFHYRLWDKDLASLEIGWLNEYELVHGERPPFNKRDATT